MDREQCVKLSERKENCIHNNAGTLDMHGQNKQRKMIKTDFSSSLLIKSENCSRLMNVTMNVTQGG